MPATDLTHIYNKYKGKWVGLSEENKTVLGVGITLRTAIAQAKKNSSERAFFMRVPKILNKAVSVL